MMRNQLKVIAGKHPKQDHLPIAILRVRVNHIVLA